MLTNTMAKATPAKQRDAKGRLLPGHSALPGADAGRARKQLNLATINALADAFARGGQQAIDKLMKNNPAMFVKMLVLLVPRELEVSHTNSIKAMTDEQIEAAIAAIEGLMARRAGTVIEAVSEPGAVGVLSGLEPERPKLLSKHEE